MVRIRKDILDAIVEKTGYSERQARRMIDKLIEASGYTIPNKMIGANILAAKLQIKINEILSTDELDEVRRYLSEPVVSSISIKLKKAQSKGKQAIKIDTKVSAQKKITELVEDNRRLSRITKRLEAEIKKLDPMQSLDKISLPRQMKSYIEKAVHRADEGSFSDAIMNCYRVSETLAKILFIFLYPDSENVRVKHEDKLKRIWNDEEREKKEYPGIRVIASLLAAILWYRNKMGAHMEMVPTREAARVCIVCIVQAIVEFMRLDIKIDS